MYGIKWGTEWIAEGMQAVEEAHIELERQREEWDDESRDAESLQIARY